MSQLNISNMLLFVLQGLLIFAVLCFAEPRVSLWFFSKSKYSPGFIGLGVFIDLLKSLKCISLVQNILKQLKQPNQTQTPGLQQL